MLSQDAGMVYGWGSQLRRPEDWTSRPEAALGSQTRSLLSWSPGFRSWGLTGKRLPGLDWMASSLQDAPQWVCLRFSSKTNRGPQELHFKKYFLWVDCQWRNWSKGLERATWVADHCWDSGVWGRQGRKMWTLGRCGAFPPTPAQGMNLQLRAPPWISAALSLPCKQEHVRLTSRVFLDHVRYLGHSSSPTLWAARGQIPPRTRGSGPTSSS